MAGTPPASKPPASLPVTEKPVPPVKKITEYVVSIDDATGAAVKIEKIDPKTGQRRELTPEEYSGAYSFTSTGDAYIAAFAEPSVAPSFAAFATTPYTPSSDAVMEAYFKGIMDYFKALTGMR